jgi:hypothetical protein
MPRLITAEGDHKCQHVPEIAKVLGERDPGEQPLSLFWSLNVRATGARHYFQVPHMADVFWGAQNLG